MIFRKMTLFMSSICWVEIAEAWNLSFGWEIFEHLGKRFDESLRCKWKLEDVREENDTSYAWILENRVEDSEKIGKLKKFSEKWDRNWRLQSLSMWIVEIIASTKRTKETSTISNNIRKILREIFNDFFQAGKQETCRWTSSNEYSGYLERRDVEKCDDQFSFTSSVPELTTFFPQLTTSHHQEDFCY
jgi:hypothetical protein